MRCIACGDEMILTNVAKDDRGAAHGYEHHTFSCSECRKIEQRVVFMKHGRECNICAAPPAIPVSTVHDEQVAPSEDLLGHLLAKMREDRRVSEILSRSDMNKARHGGRACRHVDGATF